MASVASSLEVAKALFGSFCGLTLTCLLRLPEEIFIGAALYRRAVIIYSVTTHIALP